MPAQPADLARQLFDRLGRVADQGVHGIPDELEMHRLERDANRLMKADPGKAHQLLGGIAAIRWDVDAMHSHHQTALKYVSTASAHRNYATSLQLVGLFQEAADQVGIASEKQPENLTYLRTASSFALWAGLPRKALSFEVQLARRNPDQSPADRPVALIEELLALMERQGISETDLQSAMGLTFQFLRERKLRFTHVGMSPDEDQDAAFFVIHVDLAAKEVLIEDAVLGRRFAEQMPQLSSALVVQLEPHEQISTRVNDGQAARPS